MKYSFHLPIRLAAIIAATIIFFNQAYAGPGAHGPDGEHLSSPVSGAGDSAAPRIEASTDQFELVGVLAGGELSLLIDDYVTNTPVLDARVEVTYDGQKVLAKFHSDHGDYAIDDATMLKKLTQSGEHAFVIAVLAGKRNDLLDAVLKVQPTSGAHDHHDHLHVWEIAAIIGTAAFLLALAFFAGRKWAQRASMRSLPRTQATGEGA